MGQCLPVGEQCGVAVEASALQDLRSSLENRSEQEGDKRACQQREQQDKGTGHEGLRQNLEGKISTEVA